MANNYYNSGSFPSTGSPATSASMRAELALVAAGFDKLPTLSGNGNKVVAVNAGGTALVATDSLSGLVSVSSTNFTGALSGTLTLPSGTPNAVTYLDGSRLLTSSSGLIFDGTNLGVGVTPQLGWDSDKKVIQVGTGGFIYGAGSAQNLSVGTNARFDGVNWSYIVDGAATFSYQGDGGYLWSRAVSGSAGGIATFINSMILNSSGNLGVGTDVPENRLSVVAPSSSYTSPQLVIGEASGATGRQLFLGYNTTANRGYIQSVHWGSQFTDLLLQPSGGNIGVGITPSAWAGTDVRAIDINSQFGIFNGTSGNGTMGMLFNGYLSSGTYRTKIPNAYAGSYEYSAGTGIHIWKTSGVISNAGDPVTFTQSMTLDPSSRLYVGTTTGSSGFNLNSGSWSWFYVGSSSTSSSFGSFLKGGTATPVGYIGTDGGGITGGGTGDNFGIRAQGALLFMSGAANVGRFDEAGNFLVGVTSPISGGASHKAVINYAGGSSQFGISLKQASDNTRVISFVSAADTVIGSVTTSATTTAYNTSSDYRLKKDIHPMIGALEKIAALKPVTYKWKADDSDGEGFIAHELAEVCPQAVSGEKDAVDLDGRPQYQGIDTSFLIATLAAAIQELKAIVDEQGKTIKELASK